MFVPHARVHITGIRNVRNAKSRARKTVRRKVGIAEILRMPCLMPTVGVVFIGLLVLAGGAGMCVLGYIPDTMSQVDESTNTTTIALVPKDARYYATKSLSYAGPILMGCGFFAIIVSCVLYCEIVDRYAVLLPSKPETRLKRQDLLHMILGEFKKSYFRGIEVPIRKEEPPASKGGERQMETLLKALSISTPVLLMSPDLAPTWRFSHYPYSYRGSRHLALKPRHPKLKQLGGSGSSGHEPWLKTSSLPNICDPELRRHNLPRPVPLDTTQHEAGRARRVRRFGRPSRSMDNRISWSLPQTLSRSSSGVDNPAYLHEQDRKKSVSMCVHASSSSASSYGASLRRPAVPGTARFIKASHLQPRIRLQHQQHQHIQKQQQQQLQVHHQQHQHQQQQQQQQQTQKQHAKRITKQHSSRDSDDSVGRRRCNSEEVRPNRHRPKLVRTKGTHSSGDSFSLMLPHDPPPFPPPAHFLHQHAKQPQQLQPPESAALLPVSPRTAKLLRAKCKSEDVRDKKKPDIMLLKDLFRSVDVQDPPALQPTLGHQISSASMPATTAHDYGGYLDPLAGKQCENAQVTLHLSHHHQHQQQRHQQAEKNRAVAVKDEGAFVRVMTSDAKAKCVSVGTTRPEARPRSSRSSTQDSDPSEQRYELPLLSGVARTNRQWEAERRKKINSDARHEEKSHSLDATNSKASRMEAKKSEIHRAHSFNAPLIVETKPASSKHSFLGSGSGGRDKDREKEGSHGLLRVFSPHSHKSRPKSWDGDKSQSLDGPSAPGASKPATLTVPRIERSSSFDPMAASSGRPRDGKQTKQITSYSSEFVRQASPSPCRVVFESEMRTPKSRSDELRQRTPSPRHVSLVVPLQPQRAHGSSTESVRTGESPSPSPLQHRARSPHHLQSPSPQPHPQQLMVPRLVSPAPVPRQTPSPNPSIVISPEPRSGADQLRRCQSEQQSCQIHGSRPQESHKPQGDRSNVMKHSHSHQLFGEAQQKQQQQQRQGHHHRQQQQPPQPPQQTQEHPSQPQSQQHPQNPRGSLKQRASTIVHQASVHLSLDSFPDSSVTSSTMSTSDNTTSSTLPLLSASPTPAPPLNVGGGGGRGGSEGGGGVCGGLDEGGAEGGAGVEDSPRSLRRARYTQSRSVAVEEFCPEDEDTENTPLIHHPMGSGGSAKS